MEPVTEILVLSGTWLYADEIEKEVHVIKSNFKPGTGDYEDPPEVQDDQYGEFYDIRTGKYPDGRPPYGGMFTTQNEAMEYAATVCPSLKWSLNVKAHNKRLKHRGLRPQDSQQVARRLGDS